MKRALAVVAGIFGGVVLAGVLSPALTVLLPPRLRGADVLWVVTALAVAITVRVFWKVSGPSRGESRSERL